MRSAKRIIHVLINNAGKIPFLSFRFFANYVNNKFYDVYLFVCTKRRRKTTIFLMLQKIAV